MSRLLAFHRKPHETTSKWSSSGPLLGLETLSRDPSRTILENDSFARGEFHRPAASAAWSRRRPRTGAARASHAMLARRREACAIRAFLQVSQCAAAGSMHERPAAE